MSYIYYARSMAAQTKTDVQTTPENGDLHEAVVRAIREAGARPQFDLLVPFSKEGQPPEDYIYRRDIFWLKSCDKIIAEVSGASTGVGYELAYAEFAHPRMDYPDILCVARRDAQVSAMVAGSLLAFNRYDTLNDLIRIIKEWLA